MRKPTPTVHFFYVDILDKAAADPVTLMEMHRYLDDKAARAADGASVTFVAEGTTKDSEIDPPMPICTRVWREYHF